MLIATAFVVYNFCCCFSGVYLYNLESHSFAVMFKMVLAVAINCSGKHSEAKFVCRPVNWHSRSPRCVHGRRASRDSPSHAGMQLSYFPDVDRFPRSIYLQYTNKQLRKDLLPMCAAWLMSEARGRSLLVLCVCGRGRGAAGRSNGFSLIEDP